MAGPAAKDNPNAGSDPAAARAGVRDPLPAGFAVVTLGKFLSNVAFRLVFPFLPRIAGGLGVSLGAFVGNGVGEACIAVAVRSIAMMVISCPRRLCVAGRSIVAVGVFVGVLVAVGVCVVVGVAVHERAVMVAAALVAVCAARCAWRATICAVAVK
jgi:hypothetical protein